MENIAFTYDPALILQAVITVFLPVIVGLVTKKITNSGAKAILLAVLSVVSSLLTEILNAVQAGESYDLGRGLVTALMTFVGAVALHYGLFKPTGVAEKAQEVGMGKEPAFVDHSSDGLETQEVEYESEYEAFDDDDITDVDVDLSPVPDDYEAKH